MSSTCWVHVDEAEATFSYSLGSYIIKTDSIQAMSRSPADHVVQLNQNMERAAENSDSVSVGGNFTCRISTRVISLLRLLPDERPPHSTCNNQDTRHCPKLHWPILQRTGITA